MRSTVTAVVCLLAAAQCVSAGGTNEAGKKYLAAQKEKEGVVSLDSGLMYKVLRAGKGKYHPKVDSECECHYEGDRRRRPRACSVPAIAKQTAPPIKLAARRNDCVQAR